MWTPNPQGRARSLTSPALASLGFGKAVTVGRRPVPTLDPPEAVATPTVSSPRPNPPQPLPLLTPPPSPCPSTFSARSAARLLQGEQRASSLPLPLSSQFEGQKTNVSVQRIDSGHISRPMSLPSTQPSHLPTLLRATLRFASQPPAPWPRRACSSYRPRLLLCFSCPSLPRRNCPGQNEVQEPANDGEPRARGRAKLQALDMAAFLSLLLGGCKRFVE